MFKNKIKIINYTYKHKKAFLKIEKQLIGRNTLRGYLHDSEKMFLYLFLSKQTTSKIHRKISRHHLRAKTKKDRIQQIIDWESARYTKPDKPMTAVETLYKLKPELVDEMLPIMRELQLIN